MSKMSALDWQLRTSLVEDIQRLIDAAPDSTHPEFVAGLETAIAVITHSIEDAPKEFYNA